MTDCFFPAWEWGPRNKPSMRFICASYSQSLTERDNMRCRNIVVSDRYQRLWKNRFAISGEQFTKINFANNKTGWKLATSVGGVGVGARADVVIVDDANDTMEMESETTRNTTNMWFTEVIPDRLNNQAQSAIIVIQQRLHEDDVSGVAISREMGYTHLNIPMRYDSARHCVTVLGLDKDGKKITWEDPRTEDGELAWPERFSAKIVDELERDKGPYAFCNPAEAPVLMGDLSLKPIGEIKVGDEIIGFTSVKPKTDSHAEIRRRLTKAQVLSVSVSVQPVVRMFLKSGNIIRCTPNHKWYTARKDSGREIYEPVSRIGRHLARICEPKIQQLSSEEDMRLAGWLAGFFDGEGSVGCQERRPGDKKSALITFTQGAGRNLPLCEKLEKTLNHFRLDYGCIEGIRQNLKNGRENTHKTRWYYLKGNGLPLYQKFLHVIQPTKWRDRIIEGALGNKFIIGWDRVEKIEPDGNETVYGLETTTGNYVVWGLASSNSGQYQQSPEPRGGSIIKRDFWKLWEEDKYPSFEYILASLDTAYTEKQENDPSALTIWGVFRDPNGNPKVMLVYAWKDRLQFNDLVQKVIDVCTKDRRELNHLGEPFGHPRFEIDGLLVENKAAGISAAQEIRRLVGASGKFGVYFFDPRKYGDKIARAHSVQHIWSEGIVWAPDRAFADMVIDEMAVFPKGSHDDLTDTATMAMRYLRDMGFALRREEHAVDVEQDLTYRSRQGALYPV